MITVLDPETGSGALFVLPYPPPFTMAVDGLKFDRGDLGVDRDYHCCHIILDLIQQMGNNATIMLSHNSLDLCNLPSNIINGKYKSYAVLPPLEIPKKNKTLLYFTKRICLCKKSRP